MPKSVTALSVFIASPGDVKKERELADKVITSLDRSLWKRGVCLRILRWEDTPSGLGEPQSLINEYSESADLVVVIFNRRFGSPTRTRASGTLEEFEEAVLKWEQRGSPQVKMFFHQLDPQTLQDPGRQVAKVLGFKEKLGKQRLGLYVEYKNPRDFGDRFRSELEQWVNDMTLRPDASSGAGGANSDFPAPVRPFVGRDQEVEKIRSQLHEGVAPIVTIHGIPGTGKTSLAVHALADLRGEYGGRLIYVDLSTVAGEQDIIPPIAEKLGIRMAKDVSLIESVKENLRDQRTLLLLDHVVNARAAAPQLALLSKSAPGLRMLVTSHESLGVEGEEKCRLKNLTFPGRKELEGLSARDALKNYSAITLFHKLMCLKNPDFNLRDQDVRTVAEICSQLDGLPLAIRLAVNSIGLLTLSKKSSELKKLRRGMGQLEAAFMSSYNALTPGEQTALRQSSVFVNGFTLEAAQAVFRLKGKSGEDVTDEVESLIDKDLLQLKAQPGGGHRLTMLNTIREFARSRLNEEELPAERQALRRRHATFYLELAEDAEPRLHSGVRESQGWEERLDADSGNLSAALKWSLSEEGDSDIGLRLAGALFWFWDLQGSLEEGRKWAESVLDKVDVAGEGAALAKALYCLGGLYFMQGDYEKAQEKLGRSVDLWRAAPGHEKNLGLALAVLGMTLLQQGKSRHPEARSCAEESVRIFDESDDTWGQALSLNDLGNVEKEDGRDAEAQRCYESSLAKWQQLNDSWGCSLTLSQMGDLAQRRGDYRTARRLLRDALEIQRQRGDKWGLAWSLNMLGKMDAKYPDYEKAAQHFRESLLLHRELGRKHMIAHCLEGLAHIACEERDFRRGAVLLGASTTLRESIQAPMSAGEQFEYAQSMKKIRAELNATALAAATAQGGRMWQQEELLDYAMKAG